MRPPDGRILAIRQGVPGKEPAHHAEADRKHVAGTAVSYPFPDAVAHEGNDAQHIP